MFQEWRSIDDYDILDLEIEEGQYGVVLLARHKKSHDLVAIKGFKMEGKRNSFSISSLREINILATLHHTFIVHFKEVVVKENVSSNILDMEIFIVMEYIKHNLKDLKTLCLV